MSTFRRLKTKQSFLWSQQTSESDQLTQPSPLQPQCPNPAPLNPNPNLSSLNHQSNTSSSSLLTPHPPTRSHSVAQRSESSHHSVTFIDSIKVTYTSQRNTPSSSNASSEGAGKFNESFRRLITPRSSNRLYRTPPIHPEDTAVLKSGEIEIIELETDEQKEIAPIPKIDKPKRLKKHSDTELLKDDLRVVIHRDHEMVRDGDYLEFVHS